MTKSTLSSDDKDSIKQSVCLGIIESKFEKTGSLKTVVAELIKPTVCTAVGYNWTMLDEPFIAQAWESQDVRGKAELLVLFLEGITENSKEEEAKVIAYWAWEILEVMTFEVGSPAENMRRLLEATVADFADDNFGVVGSHYAFGANLLLQYISSH